MIHPVGSYVENYIRQTLENSSEFVSGIPQQTDFNLNYQQYGGNQAGISTDWRKSPEITYCRHLIRNTISQFPSPEIRNQQVQPPYNIPTFLEYLLFSVVAASKDEYMNRDTLKQRVQALLSVPTVDELPNLSDSGGLSNLKASSNSISSYHPQQNPNDYSLVDLVEQRDYSEAIQNSNSTGFQTANEILTQSELSDLMSTQYVPRNISYYLNIFPTLPSCLYPEDIRKYQSQELDFQKNQSGSCFGVQCEQCCHMFPTRLVNDVPYGNTEAMLHPPKRQKMEPAFGVSSVNYPSSNQWNNETVFQPYETPLEVWQHSETPYSEVPQCNVEQYTNPVFDFTGISQTKNNAMDDPFGQTFKSGIFPSKGLEAGQISLEPDPQIYGVTDISNLIEIGNRSNFSMQHTLGMDPIPMDVEDIEGRTGFNHTGTNAINNVRFNSNMHTLSMDPIPIIDVEDIEGIAGFNHAGKNAIKNVRFNSSMHTPSMDPILIDLEDIEARTEFNQAGTNDIKKLSEPKADQEKRTKLSHTIVNEITSNVIDDIFAKTFETEMIPSKGLEAGHISEESDPQSDYVIEISNLMGIAIRSNFNLHTLGKNPIPIDVEDMQGRTEFNQAGTNAIKKVSEPKADQEKQTKSSHTTINEIKSNVIDDIFAQTLESEMTPSKGLEAGQKLVEPDRSYGVTESNYLMEIGIGSNCSMHTLSMDPILIDVEDIEGRTEFSQAGTNDIIKLSEPKADQEKQTKSSNTTVYEISEKSDLGSYVIDDAFEQTFQSEMIPSKGLKVVQISEKSDLGSYGVTESSNSMEIDIRSNSSMHTLSKDPIPIDVEDIQGRTEFNQVGTNAIEKVSEPKADEEKQPKSSNATVNVVSLTELFTRDQIEEHIISLRKQSVQGTTEEETGIAANICQLCAKEKLFFSPVPIYCSCCGIRIKRNTNYFCRKEEKFDAQSCFCSVCFKNSKGGCITFNETSVCKTLLERKKNDEVLEEGWVQCNKCKRWQHQICALYNNKRDLDCSAEYICPVCRLEEIKNGMHVPLPKTAYFGAKDLPRTTLSDHIEKRLFERLLQERAEWANVEGNENLEEVLAAENLSVREVLSVDKQLKVKKQFMDILSEETYPAEFPYRSRVILLFQQIEGVDVCIFAMYVQEFGSECGYPNQRCVYISYLDSVKYFRPQRVTISGEALRTFVYHEILNEHTIHQIGYLDFCKRQGFTTCYIWACPPLKGDDYILYCHPETQKTPRNDKLRHWYHSMLRKASEENVVVGLTNIYDHLFLPTGKWDSKVTASRLPYFDGDYWSGTAMELAKNIEKESGGDYEKKLKKVVTNRALKAMGHVNPSKGTAKEILVMQKLGQLILPAKEDFIVAHLQHSCMHCREVMVSGKRWFCTECKKFQECERCHTSDVHTSINGEMHTLCQVLVDDVPFNTKENDIILQNTLFEDRHKFLSFCQKNQYEFGTLRRAKYSSMMILHNLKNPTAPCLSEKQELKQDSDMMREMLEALQHASQCHSTRAQPCSNKNCLQVKKLLSHATRCTTRALGGCQNCKYTWKLLTAHSRNCKDSECRMPRCLDLKKHTASGVESNRTLTH